MSKPKPLYHHAADITLVLRSLPYVWSRRLAEAVRKQLEANAQRAEKAGIGPQRYSEQVREKIIAAIRYPTLQSPKCATLTLDRIAEAGSTSFGLARTPDIETVRAAVVEARRRNASELYEARLKSRHSVTSIYSSTHSFALSSCSTTT